jgi:DNA-binding transcriptional ArsR family regulator
MREFLAITRALSDANRTRVLMGLGGGEMCVCQIIEMLGLAPSTVSKHMSILHQARLVESRKEGRWVYYRLPRKPAATARKAIRWAREALAGDEQIGADARTIEAVKGIDKEKLCARSGRC